MDDDQRLLHWLTLAMSRHDAEIALGGANPGTYVVRDSSSCPGDYVISLVSSSGSVEHHQVKHKKNCMTTLSGKTVRSLSELLEHYKRVLDGL